MSKNKALRYPGGEASAGDARGPAAPRPDTEWLNTVHICVDGGVQTRLRVGKQTYRVWWSERWGPSVCDRNGDPIDKQPAPGSFFWTAACLWNEQGRREGEDGFGIWSREQQPTLYLRQVGRERILERIDGDFPKFEKWSPILVFLTDGVGGDPRPPQTADDATGAEGDRRDTR